jgi:indole-3-glycerol phosphate synthase
MASVLDRIVARQRLALGEPRPAAYEADLRAAAARRRPRDFRAALLSRQRPALVAECKKRSPSRGLLDPAYDPAGRARAYERGGAAAISVLTNADFDGRLADLQAVASAVSLPVLRKEFILEEVQVLEAAAHGADCILLVARILPWTRVAELTQFAHGLGLQVLVEVHSEDELEVALPAGPDLLGVNHRNLETFEVDPGLVARIAPLLPAAIPMVAESGMTTREEVLAAAAAGATAVLVGEALMRAGDAEAKAAELCGRGPGGG